MLVLPAPQMLTISALRMLRRLMHVDRRPFKCGINVSLESPKMLADAPTGICEPYNFKFGSRECHKRCLRWREGKASTQTSFF